MVEFAQMRQATPRKESTRMDLDVPSPTDEVVVEEIDESKEEEYETEAATDDDDLLPAIESTPTRKVMPRSAIKLTPPKAVVRAPASQGSSSSKKARKGK